jgi:hypothetical protein
LQTQLADLLRCQFLQLEGALQIVHEIRLPLGELLRLLFRGNNRQRPRRAAADVRSRRRGADAQVRLEFEFIGRLRMKHDPAASRRFQFGDLPDMLRRMLHRHGGAAEQRNSPRIRPVGFELQPQFLQPEIVARHCAHENFRLRGDLHIGRRRLDADFGFQILDAANLVARRIGIFESLLVRKIETIGVNADLGDHERRRKPLAVRRDNRRAAFLIANAQRGRLQRLVRGGFDVDPRAEIPLHVTDSFGQPLGRTVEITRMCQRHPDRLDDGRRNHQHAEPRHVAMIAPHGAKLHFLPRRRNFTHGQFAHRPAAVVERGGAHRFRRHPAVGLVLQHDFRREPPGGVFGVQPQPVSRGDAERLPLLHFQRFQVGIEQPQIRVARPRGSRERKHQALQRQRRMRQIQPGNRHGDKTHAPGRQRHPPRLARFHHIVKIERPDLRQRALDDRPLQYGRSDPRVGLSFQKLHCAGQAVFKTGIPFLDPQRDIEIPQRHLQRHKQPPVNHPARSPQYGQRQNDAHPRVVEVQRPVAESGRQQRPHQHQRSPAQALRPHRLPRPAADLSQLLFQQGVHTSLKIRNKPTRLATRRSRVQYN